MEMSMERLKQLVAENAPVLHMHHRDAFMPCSVEFFMANSELWLNDSEDHEEAERLKQQVSRILPSTAMTCLFGWRD